jgi:hypothetical protein
MSEGIGNRETVVDALARRVEGLAGYRVSMGGAVA